MRLGSSFSCSILQNVFTSRGSSPIFIFMYDWMLQWSGLGHCFCGESSSHCGGLTQYGVTCWGLRAHPVRKRASTRRHGGMTQARLMETTPPGKAFPRAWGLSPLPSDAPIPSLNSLSNEREPSVTSQMSGPTSGVSWGFFFLLG